MKRLKVLLLGMLMVSTTFSFASDYDKSSIPEERIEYYRQIEEARTVYEDGGKLTPAQEILLISEGIIPTPANELDETGGPDEFGYTFIDSQEDNGPEYEWIDISATGTATTGWNADITQGPYNIEFDFPFYGVEYDQFWMCSHGWLSFSAGQGVTWTNTTLPNASTPNNIIAIMWDDHIIEWFNTMYYEVIENGSLVIQIDQKYQAILSPAGVITMQYHENYTGVANSFNGETVGIENSNGTIGLQASYNTNPVNYPFGGLAIRFASFSWSVSGTVTNEDGDPVEGAYLYFAEDPASFGESDEEGNYEVVTYDIDNQPYRLICHADGYEHAEQDGIEWEEEEYEIFVDFVVEEISPRTPPYLVTWDGWCDDGVSLVLGEPGTYEHLLTAQYDDGTAANAWMLPDETGEAIWVVPFEVSESAWIVQAEINLVSPEGRWGDWPDNTADPVVVNIFDDNDGMPGEVVYRHKATRAENGVLLIAPKLKIEGRFWVGFQSVTGCEAICVDAEPDKGSLLWYSLDEGDSWLSLKAGGDPLVRLDLYAENDFYMSSDFPEAHSAGNQVRSAISPVAATHQSPIFGYVVPIRAHKQPLQPGWSNGILFDELDEFLGFNVHYSTDGGETYLQHNDEMITEDAYELTLGSDFEGNEFLVCMTASVDSEGVQIESDTSLIYPMIYNMEPERPEDLDVANINHELQTATIIWDQVIQNADGTDIIDLEEYRLYRSNELLAIIPGDEPTLYEETVADAGYYTYSVFARDEVPNISEGDFTPPTRIGYPPFWSSFEPDAEPEQPNPFYATGLQWQCGTPAFGPQGGYDGTENCWATVLNGYYVDNIEDWMVSDHAFGVIGELRLIYYHWTDFAAGDGYNVQISADQTETWDIVNPEGNYPGSFGLTSEPGFTGNSGGWQEVEIDLADFNDADSIYIGFYFASNEFSNAYGVAIDNVELWGVPREARGSIEGYVMDVNDQPMEGARIYLEEMPFFQAFTNQDGYYFMFSAPAGERNIICEYPYYWPVMVEDFEVIERDTVTLNFTNATERPMLFPDGELATTSMEIFVNINEEWGDSTGSEILELESIGTGVLDWGSLIRVITPPAPAGIGPGELRHNNDPEAELQLSELDDIWTTLLSFNAQTQAGNSGIISAVTTSDRIYVTAVYQDDETSDNLLYEYNHAGDLFMSYPYPVEMLGISGYGPTDLARDPSTGDLLGCNRDGEIYQFSTDLTTYAMIPALVNFAPMAITYDWNDGLIYLREGNSDFATVDPLSGEVIELDIEDTEENVTGMGYMPLDPEGYTIWLMATNADGQGGYVFRYNPETTEYTMDMTEVYLPEEGSSVGGMDISTGWRIDFWDITTVYQTTLDLVEIREGIFMPPSWIWVDPSSGTMQPGETLNLEILVDVRGEERFEDVTEGTEISAELVFEGSYWANPPVVDLTITFVSVDVESQTDAIPSRYALHQNYPNPFNPVTSIRFDLVEAQDVKLTVYNVLGREVARPVDSRLESGFHKVSFDGSDLASGMYFYRIESPAFTSMKKMVLIK